MIRIVIIYKIIRYNNRQIIYTTMIIIKTDKYKYKCNYQSKNKNRNKYKYKYKNKYKE